LQENVFIPGHLAFIIQVLLISAIIDSPLIDLVLLLADTHIEVVCVIFTGRRRRSSSGKEEE
jgi:hypothetical protein